MKFRCDCATHILEITHDKKTKTLPAMFSLAIYDIYSPKGRKYKKPKLVSDVVIMNNKYPKEYDKLVQFILKSSKTREQAICN